MWYTDIQWNITQSLKKNEIMPFATKWVDLEIIIISDVSQTGEANITYHLYVDSVFKRISLFTKQK